jgi:hypothetical protein
VRSGEGAKRRELDDGLYLIFKEHRQHNDVLRDGFEEAGANGQSGLWKINNEHALLFRRTLADEPFADGDPFEVPFRRAGVGGEKGKRTGFFRVHLVDQSLLRVDQRRELGEEHTAHGG